MTTKLTQRAKAELAWEIATDLGRAVTTKAAAKLDCISLFGVTPELYAILPSAIESLLAPKGYVASVGTLGATGIVIVSIRGR